MLSVICPTYNEERYISRCMESILGQDFPMSSLELIFVDGMSTDRTREIISEYIQRYAFIRLIDNPNRTAPWAMNIGIEASRGDVIIRLDAHASYERNYFSALTRRLVELNADNVGCVCLTDVRVRTPKTLAIREVLSNRFGVGNSVFRTGVDKVRQVDTVPFGCWKRTTFDKFGLFDVRLVRNQDYELNSRIMRGGGKIYIVPDTHCTYYARETFSALARQNYMNGKWNVLVMWYKHDLRAMSLRHFVPVIFILSLVLPAVSAILWWPLIYISAFSLSAYALLFTTVSAALASKRNLSFFFLFSGFATLHFSNGWGALSGILSLPFTRR